ncbi:MAG: hypothetical protein ACRC2S_12300 [Waterburya sp.]
MTAEIAILNKTAVVLAADSAVTVTGGINGDIKIYKSVNKLFTLSKYEPVGIMIYDSADFMGIPWETIIKEYRSYLGTQNFEKLLDYCNHFIEFLETNIIFSEDEQSRYIEQISFYLMTYLKNKIIKQIEKYFQQDVETTEIESITKTIINKIVKEEFEVIFQKSKLNNIGNVSNFRKQFKDKYRKIINDKISEVFEQIPLTEQNKNKVIDIIVYYFSTETFINKSGVVITGFGRKEFFPSLNSLVIECVIDNKLKYMQDRQVSVEAEGASIIPFAQDDMVRTFIQGIDPEMYEFSLDYLEKMFEQYSNMIFEKVKAFCQGSQLDEFSDQLRDVNNFIINKYNNDMSMLRAIQHTNPILEVIQFLPKDELASMAEALINITSLKRKVSGVLETVGGPVDVAVISKGDGFVWIKRKHYFKPELNQPFFHNYFINDKE